MVKQPHIVYAVAFSRAMDANPESRLGGMKMPLADALRNAPVLVKVMGVTVASFATAVAAVFGLGLAWLLMRWAIREEVPLPPAVHG